MYLDNFREELELNGIPSSIVTVYKNGNETMGLRIGRPEDSICPIIYPTGSETPQMVLSKAKEALRTKPEMTTEQLMNWDYVRNHIRLDVQRRSNENVLKRKCQNLDLVMRVVLDIPGDGHASTKVTPVFPDVLGVTAEDLWNAAEENSRNQYQIRSMMELIGIEDDGNASMFVVTNSAAALAFPEIFRDFCTEHGEKGCFCLPSSTEEVIVIPDSFFSGNPQELAEMVKAINADVVKDPNIELDAVAYHYDLTADRIEIAAEA